MKLMARTPSILAAVFLLLGITALPPRLHAMSGEAFIGMLDFSGYFRVRSWNVVSRTYIPEKIKWSKNYRTVDYLDLFMRNRLSIKPIDEIEIRSVFDVSALFGKGAYSIDGSPTNFITRNVYGLFRPFRGSELSVGLLPFSLPGGYLLARDATGLHYIHHFTEKKVSVYAAYIKAIDDADDSFGVGSDAPDYIWDDICFAGVKFAIGSIFSAEAYYAYQDDRHTSNRLTFETEDFTAGLEGDGRKASLHWVGLHTTTYAGIWFLRIGGIVNAGHLHVRNEFFHFRKILVRSGLLEFETGIDVNNLRVSLIAEGATGDPDKPNAGISFQHIRGAHNFSFIVVDSIGGISLRGSGASCWYGLYGSGVKISHTFIDSLRLELGLLHFETTKVMDWRGKGVTWFGDEADLGLEYRLGEFLSLTINAGAFLPQRAYCAQRAMKNNYADRLTLMERLGLITGDDWLYRLHYINLRGFDHHSSRSAIFEIMAGATVSYD
ncbi:MAG: hypothetical protein JW838_12215 [Spirochaetes bacterium]|nr:hypothetical protein [Spirochaetota bacterium]